MATVSSGGYFECDTEENNCVSSWATAPGTALTHAAVVSTSTAFAVQDGSKIISWGSDASDLKSAKMHKTSSPVVGLFALEDLDCGAAVLENGELLVLDPELKSIGRHSMLEKKSKVVWAHCLEEDGDVFVCVLVDEGKGHYDVLCFLLDMSDGEEHPDVTLQSSFQTPSKESLVACCCALSRNEFKFAVYYSNGMLEMFRGRPGENAEQTLVSVFKCSSADSYKVAKGAGVNKAGVVLAMVKSSYIIVAGCRGGVAGVEMAVWDALFGSRMTTAVIAPQGKKASGSPTGLGFSPEGDFCLLMTTSGAAGMGVYLPEITLASLVGKTGKSAESVPYSFAPIDITSQLDSLGTEPLFPANTLTAGCAGDGENEGVAPFAEVSDAAIEKLFAPRKGSGVTDDEAKIVQELTQEKDQKKFLAKLTSFVDSKRTGGKSSKKNKGENDQTDSEKMGKFPSDGSNAAKKEYVLKKREKKRLRQERKNAGRVRVNLSQAFVAKVGQKCVEAKFFEGLRLLIETDMVSARTLPDMVPSLMEHEQLDLIELSLIHVHDLTEEELVRLVKFFVTELDPSKADQYVKSREDARKEDPKVLGGMRVGNDSGVETFLYLVISAPRNDVFMQQQLRRLEVSEVVTLLKYLHKWMERHCEHLERVIRKNKGFRIPSFAQVIDWICLITDAHFVKLVLTPESHKLLTDLQKLVNLQVTLCDKIRSMRGYISHYMHHKALPTTDIPDYSIEVINL